MSPSSSSASELPPIDFQIVPAVIDLHDHCPHCRGERTSRRVHLPSTPRNFEDFQPLTLVQLLNEVFIHWDKNLDKSPQSQKYYCISKRLFTRRMRRAGGTRAYALGFIRFIENNLA